MAVASDSAIVRPPARRIARKPSTPSRPIPVRITASALRPKAAATESKRKVPEGRKPPTAGLLERWTVRPRETPR